MLFFQNDNMNKMIIYWVKKKHEQCDKQYLRSEVTVVHKQK